MLSKAFKRKPSLFKKVYVINPKAEFQKTTTLNNEHAKIAIILSLIVTLPYVR